MASPMSSPLTSDMCMTQSRLQVWERLKSVGLGAPSRRCRHLL